MRLRSRSWALIDRRGYQPWPRREDPSLLWPFEAGVGVRSQNPEDNDAGFCFLPCGLVELLSWDRREMRRDLRPQPPLCRACPSSFALGNVCSHSSSDHLARILRPHKLPFVIRSVTYSRSPAGQFCAITQNEHAVVPKVFLILRRPQSPIETRAHRFLILCGLVRPAVLIVGDVKRKAR